MLGGLLEEIARREGWDRAAELLRAVGQRAAAASSKANDPDGRAAAAAAAFRSLGGDVEVQRTEYGWHLQGTGCPLSAVTAKYPQVCSLAKALIEDITGQPVAECCERGDGPRCAFRIGERALPPSA